MTLALTNFGVAAAELGLTLEQQEKAKALAATLKVGLSDPDVYRIALHVKTEGTLSELTSKLTAHSEAVNADLKSKASAFLTNIEKTAGKALEEKIASIPLTLSTEAHKVFKQEVATVVRVTNDDLQRQTFNRERFRFGILAIGAVVAALALGGWVYVLKGDIDTSDNQQVAAFMERPDAEIGLRVNQSNNWLEVLGNCKVFERQGRKMCNADIAFDKPLTSSVGTDGLRLIWTQIAVKLGDAGLLLAGLAIGAVGGMFFRGKRTA